MWGWTWVDAVRVLMQLWMGLHTGRWFACLGALVLDRLKQHLQLDTFGRHAADVDDVQLSLAAAVMFVGSYVASPPHEKTRDSSPTFELLYALLLVALSMPAVWLGHWVVGLFGRRVKDSKSV